MKMASAAQASHLGGQHSGWSLGVQTLRRGLWRISPIGRLAALRSGGDPERYGVDVSNMLDNTVSVVGYPT